MDNAKFNAEHGLLYGFDNDGAFGRAVECNFKIPGKNGKEISIALDNSCGAMLNVLGRAEMRLYRGAEDCTSEVFGYDGCWNATTDDLRKALEWLAAE